MSIVLKAFPLAFLISPNSSDIKNSKEHWNLSIEREKLEIIKVATNIKLEQANYLMENLGIPYKYKSGTYILNNGINIRWDSYNAKFCAILSLNNKIPLSARHLGPASYLTKQGEILMRTFEVMLKKNIRNVNAKEIFFYCYKTNYKAKYQVLELLQEHNIENISKATDTEIRFRYRNKNYKFIRENKRDCYYLESEQKISLVNIHTGDKQVTSKSLATNYTDKDALMKTLKEHGATYIESDELNVYCELLGMQFVYSKDNAKDSYNLEINRITDENKCSETLKGLNDEYGLNIQDLTYKKILERIKQKNMRLENEQVDEENSIILTIDIG